MEWETYDLEKMENGLRYEFYSEGPKGRIRKVIYFQQITELGTGVFNLAFGDYNNVIKRIDDMIVSNNSDQLKVMHTVAVAIIDFCCSRPNAYILIKGISSSRTRLYQMKIAGFWSEVGRQFEILGEFEKQWQPFQKGTNYKRFLVYKK
jgi:hypothetical protein